MQDYIRKRAVRVGLHIIATSDTIRQTADVFHFSKTVIHKDISERLPKINKDLYSAVRDILSQHEAQKHLNGGEATKLKWQNVRKGAAG
jgi:putative DeoR family transcriptional regulator (stage III sporulation protein D)